MNRIFFTVTNDLSYDQRMIRICTSLAGAGYDVTLVGRKLPASIPLSKQAFQQKRIRCFFKKGFPFYAEYNLRLFFFLLFQKAQTVCAIDLDTILPVLFVTAIKRTHRIYDAHEFFTEMKEVRTRPFIKKCWTAVERFAVPRFHYGYTVSQGLADAFTTKYKRNYEVTRNLPVLRALDPEIQKQNFLLFQGAVNEARGFEYLIPALKRIPYRLVVCGDGNFMPQLKSLINEHGVADKVELRGMMPPDDLWPVAQQAALGLGLSEKEGINQFYALPNKFTDYMHAGLPQLGMNFPEYRKINDAFPIAILLDELSTEAIVRAVNSVMENAALLRSMREHALRARLIYCWEAEEKKLLQFYRKIFASV